MNVYIYKHTYVRLRIRQPPDLRVQPQYTSRGKQRKLTQILTQIYTYIYVYIPVHIYICACTPDETKNLT